jgi:hypothetical protein
MLKMAAGKYVFGTQAEDWRQTWMLKNDPLAWHCSSLLGIA